MTAWALADPMLSGPDEPAHIIRAEAIVRGQLIGTPVKAGQGFVPQPEGDPEVFVHVPGVLENVNTLRYWCYIFNPDVTAACAPTISGPPHDIRTETYVGRYPPLYYAVVGLPSLADPGPPGIIGMRLVSALLNSLLLAAALALGLRRSRLAALGVLAAVVPTAVYYGASVNPNGFEMSAAVCFFASVLALVLPAPKPPSLPHILTATTSGCLLALARGLSPLFVVIALAAAATVADRDRLKELARRRAARLGGAVLALALVAAVAWIVAADALLELAIPYPARVGNLHLVRLALDATPHYLSEMIGVFGANNIPAPLFATVVVVAVAGVLVVGALLVGSRRERLALGGLLVAVVVVPIAADVIGAHRYGFGWQGRYTVPIAVGVPILAGLVLARRLPGHGRRSLAETADRLVLPAALLLGAAQFLCLWWDLRRFMVGARGPLSGVFHHGIWQPPLDGPVILLLALAGVVTVSIATLLGQRTRTPPTITADGTSP
jgi:hypothetical protein